MWAVNILTYAGKSRAWLRHSVEVVTSGLGRWASWAALSSFQSGRVDRRRAGARDDGLRQLTYCPNEVFLTSLNSTLPFRRRMGITPLPERYLDLVHACRRCHEIAARLMAEVPSRRWRERQPSEVPVEQSPWLKPPQRSATAMLAMPSQPSRRSAVNTTLTWTSTQSVSGQPMVPRGVARGLQQNELPNPIKQRSKQRTDYQSHQHGLTQGGGNSQHAIAQPCRPSALPNETRSHYQSGTNTPTFTLRRETSSPPTLTKQPPHLLIYSDD